MPGWHFELAAAGERRHFERRAQGRLRVRDRHAADQVLAVALEERMGEHGDEAVAVARRAAVGTRLALAGDAHPHLVVDAGGDFHFGDDLLELLARAAADGAGVLDRRAFAVALRAGRLHADDAGRLNHAALPAAIGANLAPAALRGTGALAGFARFVALELDGLA